MSPGVFTARLIMNFPTEGQMALLDMTSENLPISAQVSAANRDKSGQIIAVSDHQQDIKESFNVHDKVIGSPHYAIGQLPRKQLSESDVEAGGGKEAYIS